MYMLTKGHNYYGQNVSFRFTRICLLLFNPAGHGTSNSASFQYLVYHDNYYGSPFTAAELLERGVYSLGTVRYGLSLVLVVFWTIFLYLLAF